MRTLRGKEGVCVLIDPSPPQLGNRPGPADIRSVSAAELASVIAECGRLGVTTVYSNLAYLFGRHSVRHRGHRGRDRDAQPHIGAAFQKSVKGTETSPGLPLHTCMHVPACVLSSWACILSKLSVSAVAVVRDLDLGSGESLKIHRVAGIPGQIQSILS
jgi:hypothetical protein